MSSVTGRKIIQVTTCPINSIEIEGSIHITTSVFVLCDNGTLWMQIIGGGGEWTPIDGPPQGEIMDSANDIYVVVADNDGGKEPSGPLVFEQYTINSDLQTIKDRAKYLGEKYGICRIAKLKFIDSETESGENA